MIHNKAKYSDSEQRSQGRKDAIAKRKLKPHTIYLLKNKHTNQIYIGSSWHPFSRFGKHLENAISGKKDCPKLYNAMRIHPSHNDWDYVELFQIENGYLAFEAEDYMIEFYNSIQNGLNTKLNREMILTNEIKEKMSKTRIERKLALGVNNVKASMAEDQVKEIKILINQNVPVLDIEAKTGISAKKIRRIKRGETWNKTCEVDGFIPSEAHDLKGENNGRAKLTAEQVKQIKLRLMEGKSHKIIAEEFNITKHSVESIKYGNTWTNIIIDGWIVKEKTKQSYPQISQETAINIKTAIAQGKSTKDIVNEFKVSKTTVQFIKTGKTWKNLNIISKNME